LVNGKWQRAEGSGIDWKGRHSRVKVREKEENVKKKDL
tara:strand:+ start:52 stop:165 length:114 start_codon:yes stop_codon:yes gene_type:complete